MLSAQCAASERRRDGAIFSPMAVGQAMTRREEPISLMSAGLSHCMMGATVLLAALPFIFTLPAQPERPAKVADNSASATAPAAPGTPAPDAAQRVEPPKDEWPKEEIARATEQCTHILASLAAEVEYLEPIKKGEC